MRSRVSIMVLATLALAGGLLYAWGDDPREQPVALRITRIDGGHRAEAPATPLDRAHVEANAATLAAALREAAEAGRWTTADEVAARDAWAYLEREAGDGPPDALVDYGGARFLLQSPPQP